MSRRASGLVWIAMCGCPATTATGPTASAPTTAPAPAPAPAPATTAAEAPPPPAGEPGIVTLPDTVGKLKADAEAALHAAGIADVRTDNDPGTVDFAVDKVCSQVPGGGHETRASLPVVLRYCKGPVHLEDKRVNLVGLKIEEAKQRARAAGFTGQIEVIEAGDVSCSMGTVCAVSPDRWELNQDHAMQLYTPKKLNITTPD